MNFRLGELFCGAGGLAWGAFNAAPQQSIQQGGEIYSISHRWANDLDLSACQTYAANLLLKGTDDAPTIKKAITNVSGWRTLRASSPEQPIPSIICDSVEKLTQYVDDLPDIDGFAFGFPCNDFSAVGERRGLEGEFGPLYTHGIRVLDVKRPRWFIAENVEGLLHRDKGRVWEQIKKELSEAGPGYVLTTHLYRFEQYGVPQYRARLVIVGISQTDADQGITFRIPAPTMINGFRTARWAMEHDPTLPNVITRLTETVHNHRIKRITEPVRRRLEHTLPGQNAWNADIPEDCALHVQNAHLSMIYRRLVPDEPAYTITGNGGGGTHGYHWSEARALTNRERARLQSFPDTYRFHGGEDSIRRQIGMAVPPLAAQVIFEAILKTYARQPYNWVPATTVGSAQRRRREVLPQAELPLEPDTLTQAV